MIDRLSPRALLLIALAVPIAGCTNQQVDSISVSPTAQTLSVGQTVQFTATGSVGHGATGAPTTSNITSQCTWTSSAPSVATVNSSGLATAVGAGSSTITATINGYTGILTATATITVTGAGTGTGSVSGITSLSIIPGSQAVTAPGETSQFIAIGTTSSGATINLTNQVNWSSSSVQIGTISATTGLATAVGQGTTTITAIYQNPGGGSTIAGTATFTVNGGTTEQYTAVQIVPNSQAVSASGQTGQFLALATSGTTGLQQDVTNSPNISWLSSIPTIATVSSGLTAGNGVVTGVSQGSDTITVELKNQNGTLVSDSGSVTVTLTPAPEPLLSLSIIPSSITVGNLGDAGQFLAIGTYSTSPTVRDLTNQVLWQSDEENIFPVITNTSGAANPGADAGVVTAEGNGSAVIIAEATDPTTGSIQDATATFNCPLVLPTATAAGSCYPGSEAAALLSTLTVYNEGLNTTQWLVTAASATGTPDVLHCGPGSTAAGLGGSVCVASYPSPAGAAGVIEVVLTAQATGAAFGGWSYNCLPSTATGTILTAPPYYTPAGPNYCVVYLTTNDTVGAIFN
jgi:uncharacterized protein YjdB